MNPTAKVLRKFELWIVRIVAAAGFSLAVAGAVADVRWIDDNTVSIMLLTLSVLLAFVVGEFVSLRADIGDMFRHTGGIHTIDDPARLHQSAAAALRLAIDSPNADRSVLIVSAAGIPNDRPKTSGSFLKRAVSDYHAALVQAVTTPGWRVRMIFYIDTEDRLDAICSQLAGYYEAPDLEAKALVSPTRDLLAPLIIGDSDVFLAQADRRFRDVQAGVWLRDERSNQFARSYFDELWHDQTLATIRRATGLDNVAIEDLRAELRRPSNAPQLR